MGRQANEMAAGVQATRERATACLGISVVLTLVGIGVLVSGGEPLLGGAMTLCGVVALCAFGIIWDTQPRPQRGPGKSSPGSASDGAIILTGGASHDGGGCVSHGDAGCH